MRSSALARSRFRRGSLVTHAVLTVQFLLALSATSYAATSAISETGSTALNYSVLLQHSSSLQSVLPTEKPDSGLPGKLPETAATSLLESSSFVYNGIVRIYVVEPESRWMDSYWVPFDFGLLDFAYNQPISLGYADTIKQTLIWTSSNFGALLQDNIMVLAAVFNGEGHTAYSNPGPPPSNPFTAHWADAAAAASPGQTGTDTASGSFTHNVFIEWAASSG